MINPVTEPSQRSTSPVAAEKAFSFISRLRDSAGADLRLMQARATNFRNLATSFDRELENFLNSASSFRRPPPPPSSSPSELEFMKRLRPKLSELRRAYSSPDFSRNVLQKWSPSSRIRIDLSTIKKRIVSEVEDTIKVIEFDGDRIWLGQKKVDQKSASSKIFGNLKSSEFVEKVKATLVCVFLFVFTFFVFFFSFS